MFIVMNNNMQTQKVQMHGAHTVQAKIKIIITTSSFIADLSV